MRVRLKQPIPQRSSPAGELDMDRWYEVRPSGIVKDFIDVKIGDKWIEELPISLFEVRSVPDNHWQDHGYGPMPIGEGGARPQNGIAIIECPEGHQQEISNKEIYNSEILCKECGEAYSIDW